jgi:hypothetical protein
MSDWVRGPVALIGLVIGAYIVLQIGLAIIGVVGWALETWWSQ